MKQAELIRAALDGKIIEQRIRPLAACDAYWWAFPNKESAIHCMVNYPDRQYRIKPELIERFITIEPINSQHQVRTTTHLDVIGARNYAHIAGIAATVIQKLYIDPDTRQIVKTEVVS